MAGKSTTHQSSPQASPLAVVLEHLVFPAITAGEEPGCDSSSIEMPETGSDDHPYARGLLRGGWMANVRPMPVDNTRTLLRPSLLSGYIISDCPSPVSCHSGTIRARSPA